MFVKLLIIAAVLLAEVSWGASFKASLLKFTRNLAGRDIEIVFPAPHGNTTSDLDFKEDLKPLPSNSTEKAFPHVSAESAIVVDSDTKEVLYEKDSLSKRPMASITKVMTGILTIENTNLDDVVEITSDVCEREGSDMDLNPGEKIRLRDLLIGMLVKSANDAALASAKYVGGGSVSKFVDMMNEKADELGLSNTHYANPHGFDDPDHYSSAFDIALLMSYAIQNRTFKEIVAIKEHDVHILNKEETRKITATNELLKEYQDIVEGGKTGYTEEAGESLVLVAKNPEGHRIISVVLNSPDRFYESKLLIDSVFARYEW